MWEDLLDSEEEDDMSLRMKNRTSKIAKNPTSKEMQVALGHANLNNAKNAIMVLVEVGMFRAETKPLEHLLSVYHLP